jgi:hypothetical protein
MNDSEFNKLRETGWRRRLSADEELQAQSYLATHPQAQAEWEEDLALTRHLQELPDAPVPSNFTSLVLQAVDAESAAPERPARFHWSGMIHRWSARVALAAVVGLLAVGGLLKYEQTHTRKQVALDVEEFVRVSNLPGPEIFEHFDAIEQLQPVSYTATDEDLLAALK